MVVLTIYLEGENDRPSSVAAPMAFTQAVTIGPSRYLLLLAESKQSDNLNEVSAQLSLCGQSRR